jgi:glycosyltransferase involved in cell wall biosynthesis
MNDSSYKRIHRQIASRRFPNMPPNRIMPRTRRVAIVCQPWDNIASQSDNSTIIVSYHLALCLARDCHVTIYGRRGPGQKRWEVDGIVEFKRLKVFQIPQKLIDTFFGILAHYQKRRIKYVLSIWYHLLYSIRIAISIRVSRYDVVHVHNFLQFTSIIKFFNPTATICLHMHCAWLRQFATAASERRLRKVDLIIGVSDCITEGIRNRYPTLADRCHTVYNGVDTARFCPGPVVSSPDDRPARLLYIGRLSPEKGVHLLIRAFKILAESRPTLQLDIVGYPGIVPYIYLLPDPENRAAATLEPFYGSRAFDMVRRQFLLKGEAYLADLAAAAAGDSRIIFHGGVLQSDTIAFYRRAAILVAPSIIESFGMPVAEASACALPVVASDCGGLPEIVEHRRTGILVSCGEAEEMALAISQLIDDPELARAMGEAGRQRILERFTWEASARRLADLIEKLSPAHESQSLSSS